MFGQSPIVIAGDPIIIWSALIAAVGCFGLFLVKVSDRWYKFKQRKTKQKLSRNAEKATNDLLN